MHMYIKIGFLLPLVFAAPILALADTPKATSSKSTASCASVLNHQVAPLLDDKPESLCQFNGKVVLVVNTASQCGYTPQYEGLESLYRKYAAQGFVVLGFPANDFGAQEKGDNAQIAKFCKLNFGVSFPMYQKLNQPIMKNPLFAGLIAQTQSAPQWNFHKYLIGRDGKVQAFGSNVEPQSKTLVQAIETAVASKQVR